MAYRGRVENGTIVLDEAVELPEGISVEVELVKPEEELESNSQGPTLYDHFKSIIGTAEGLPPDASRNKYHYLYGAPKV